MCFILIAAIIFGGIYYCTFVTFFIKGWYRTPYFRPSKTEKNFSGSISVVIACRDEEEYLPQLLNGLKQQSKQQFEIILINDHSTDRSVELMLKAKEDFPDLKIINALGYGKKNALREGIYAASGDFIICTDADCLPEKEWIETISAFQAQQDCDLIICPVKMLNGKGVFSQLEILDFTSLIASGAGAAGMGKPILCNGANLAFKKDIWLKNSENLHDELLSGDDMFLLESVVRQNGKVRFLKSKQAFVSTFSVGSISRFFNQRQRWASKSPSYTNKTLIAVACSVFGISLLQVFLFFYSIFVPFYWLLFASLFALKYAFDFSLLYSVRLFFDLKGVLFYSFLLSLFYPFYIVYAACSALFCKQTSWK